MNRRTVISAALALPAIKAANAMNATEVHSAEELLSRRRQIKALLELVAGGGGGKWPLRISATVFDGGVVWQMGGEAAVDPAIASDVLNLMLKNTDEQLSKLGVIPGNGAPR